MAIDSSASTLLTAAADSVHAHIVMETNELQTLNLSIMNETTISLTSVPGIADVLPLAWIPQWTFTNGSRSFSQEFSGYVGFLPDDSDRILQSYDILGDIPEAGEVAVSARMADELGLHEGDAFMAQYRGFASNASTNASEIRYANLSLRVSHIWYQGPSPTRDVNVYFDNPVILGMRSAEPILEELQSQFGADKFMIITYLVWIDLARTIVAGNVKETLSNLNRVATNLQETGASCGIAITESNLEEVLTAHSNDIQDLGELFLETSVPIMALGTYLSAVGIELGHRERRREIAIQRSRGASSRQIFLNLLIECIALGGTAGVIGIVVGTVISRPLLSSATSILGSPVEVKWTELYVTPYSLLVAVLFGILLAFLASVRMMRKSLKLELAEALHHHVPAETAAAYDPRWDIVSLALVAVCIIGIMVPQDTVTQTVDSFIVQQMIAGLRILAIALFPVAPILLSVSIVRLATRGPSRFYSRIARISRLLGREVEYFARRNVSRDLRRSETLTMLISLVLCFGIFVSVTSDSAIAYEVKKVEYEVGADVRVQASLPEVGIGEGVGVNLTILDRISQYQDVRSLSWFRASGVTVSGVTDHIAMIDAGSYSETVRPGGFWFVKHGTEALSELRRNGTVIVKEDFADSEDIRIGDVIDALIWLRDSVTGDYMQLALQLNVVDLARGMPGLDSSNLMFIDRKTVDFLSDAQLANTSHADIGVLINLEPGGYPGAFAVVANGIFVEAGLQPKVVDLGLSLKAMRTNPKFAGLRDFLGTEYVMATVIASIGTAMAIMISIGQRRLEFGAILARGCSRSQLRRILVAESLILLSVGLIVGSSAGILASYLYNSFSVWQYDQLGRTLSLTNNTLLLILISVASLVLATLIASHLGGRMKINEVLRIRGG